MKSEAKTLSAPTGQLNTSNLSINRLMEQQREKSAAAPTNLPRNPFERDDLVRLWKTAAHAEKIKGEDPIYHIMIKRDPQQVDDVKYHFEVDGPMQKTRMDLAIGDILNRLRDELKNFDLEISISVTAEQVEETKFLTGNDKFEKMARKNSNLFDFKNRFGLDIDY